MSYRWFLIAYPIKPFPLLSLNRNYRHKNNEHVQHEIPILCYEVYKVAFWLCRLALSMLFRHSNAVFFTNTCRSGVTCLSWSLKLRNPLSYARVTCLTCVKATQMSRHAIASTPISCRWLTITAEANSPVKPRQLHADNMKFFEYMALTDISALCEAIITNLEIW